MELSLLEAMLHDSGPFVLVQITGFDGEEMTTRLKFGGGLDAEDARNLLSVVVENLPEH